MKIERMNDIKQSPYYDSKQLRIILPLSRLRDMPVVPVTDEERYKLMENADYNPTIYYSHYVPLHVGEVGHDSVNRYVMNKALK